MPREYGFQERLQMSQGICDYTPRAGRGYHSECVFVPRREVWATIYKRFGGVSIRQV